MLVVVSMHRSGSSALAGLLAENGFFAGSVDMHVKPERHNQKGFIELREVTRINEEIIRSSSKGHLCPIGYNAKRELSAKLQEQIATCASELVSKGITMLKDPRFCLTWHHWEKHFSNNRVVLLYRQPLSVAKSLYTRQNYPINAGLALWEFYYGAAFDCIDAEMYFVDFDDLNTDPSSVIQGILGWANADASACVDTSFFDRDLIHYELDDKQSQLLSERQTRLYQSMKQRKPLSLEFAPDSEALRMLQIIDQFIEFGYDPGEGRLMDLVAKQRLYNLDILVKKQRQEYFNLTRMVQTLLDSRASSLVEKFYKMKARFGAKQQKESTIAQLRTLLSSPTIKTSIDVDDFSNEKKK